MIKKNLVYVLMKLFAMNKFILMPEIQDEIEKLKKENEKSKKIKNFEEPEKIKIFEEPEKKKT